MLRTLQPDHGLLFALLDVYQLPTLFYHFALDAPNSLDDTIRRRSQCRLCLHALEHNNGLALLHAVADGNVHLDHKTQHQRTQRAPHCRAYVGEGLRPCRSTVQDRRSVSTTEDMDPLGTRQRAMCLG